MATVTPLSIATSIQLPLPIYASVPVARLVDDAGTEYAILAGVPEDVAQEIRARSLDATDEALQNNTRDRERFGPEGSYESWYEKGRLPIVLLSSANELAAIAWYGPAPVPTDSERTVDASGEWDTAGYRAYGTFRGKRLMRPFARYTLDLHTQLFPGRKVWIETNEDNAAGRRVFEGIGYRDVGKRASNGRIMMVYE